MVRILHINCADFGSTGKIIDDISKEAYKKKLDSFLFVPFISNEKSYINKTPMCFNHEPGINRRFAGVLGLRYGFAPISTSKMIKGIKQVKPDIVHLHAINGNIVNVYKLLNFLKSRNIPLVVTNHSEFFYTGTCTHAYNCEKWKTGCGDCADFKRQSQSFFFDRTATAWKKMQNAFSNYKNVTIVSVSPWVYSRSSASPILEGLNQKVVLNGLDTQIFNASPKDEARKRLGLSTYDKYIVHVTARFNPDDEKEVKGSSLIVDLAKRLQPHNIKLLVVGPCEKYTTQLPDNIVVVGPIMDQQKLADYYSAADLTVIASQRETFSMIVAESLCCGTPVLGFKAGGPESIAIEEYSQFLEYGDVDGLYKNIIEKWMDFKNTQIAEELSNKAKVVFSGEKMAKEYISIYEEMLN